MAHFISGLFSYIRTYVQYFFPTFVGTIFLPTFVGIWYCTNQCYISGATFVLISGTGVAFTLYMWTGRPRTYPPGIVPTIKSVTHDNT